MRDAATEKGLDWSQVKALLKAQAQDERDGGDGKRVNRIIEKADFASAYADMLGLGAAKMNENNFSPPDSVTAITGRTGDTGGADDDDAIPGFLRRGLQASAP